MEHYRGGDVVWGEFGGTGRGEFEVRDVVLRESIGGGVLDKMGRWMGLFLESGG